MHLLVLADVGGLEQVRVDRDRADVVQSQSVTVARWIFDFSIVRLIRVLSQDRVVDQAGAADAGGDGEQGRAVDALDGGKVVGGAQLQVLGLDAGGFELRARGGQDAAASRCAGRDRALGGRAGRG